MSRPLDARAAPVAVLFLGLLVAGFVVATGLAVAGSATPAASEPAGQAAPQGPLAGTTSLDDANTTVVGTEANESAGFAVANVGDVNGDGQTDLAVAAPNSSLGGPDSGAVYLFYGPVDPGSVSVDEANATLVGAPGDRAGWAVAGGDVDGDGRADVVVGAPFNDSAGTDSGAVYVVDGEAPRGRVSLPDDATVLGGPGSGAQAGRAVAVVGNETENATLVGAPFARVREDGDERRGAAYLVRGAPEAGALADAAAVTYTGAGPADRAGWAVADAFDVDDDGRPEALVGAPGNDSTAVDAGAAYVVDIDGEGTVPLAETRTLVGAAAGDRAGYAVAGANDTDGDGIDDLLVGAPYNDSGGDDAGIAYLAYGHVDWADRAALADESTSLVGAGAGDHAGWSVSVAGSGDVTCDGLSDVLVGAPYNDSGGEDAGTAYVVYGRAVPRDRTALADADARLVGANAGDRAGWTVSEGGDLSGDGREDVVVGAPSEDSGGSDAGAAYVLSGACPPQPDPEPVDPVSIDQRCTDDGGVLVVRNTNDRRVNVELEGPDGDVTRVTLAPGETHRFDGLADGAYAVRTVRDGTQIGETARVQVRCAVDAERADVRTRCDDDGGRLFVSNPNDVTVRVEIEGPDGFERSRTLDPGEEQGFRQLADGDYTVRTFTAGDGSAEQVGSRETVTFACPTEQVDVRTRCTDDGGSLTVTNPNEEAVEVEIEGPDGFERRVTVEAGETRTVEELADGEYTVDTFAAIQSNPYDIGDGRSVTVECEADLDRAEVSQRCTDDGGVLRIENPNDAPVEVTVTGPNGRVAQVTVDPDETETVDGLADGEYTVRTATADGEQSVGDSETVTVACPTDRVGVRNRCTEDGATVTVRNPNEEAVQVDIEGPDGFERRVTIGGGESRTFERLADGEYTVRTFSAIDENVYEIGDGQTLRVSCPTEEVEVETRCTADGGVLAVTNPNEEAVQVDVEGAGDFERRVTLAAGETRRFDDLGDGDYEVRTFSAIDENVYQIGDAQERAIACPTEEVDVETRCTESGGVLVVANPNEESVQVDVDGPEGIERRITVEGGETERIGGLVDGEYTVRTFSAIDENVYQIGDGQTASVACPTEEVDVETDCTDDGDGTLTVTNPNDEAVQVDVEGPDGFERRVTVEADETRTFEGVAEGTYRVRTFSAIDENVYQIGDGRSASVDCEVDLERAEVSQRCSADGGILRIENPNDAPVEVTVDGPDGRATQITLEAGETRTVDELADGEYTVRTATADGEQSVGEPQSLTIACPTEEVEVQQRCTADGGVLAVTNPNEEAVQVDVEGAGDFERRVTVEAGETRTFEELGDGEYTVRTFSAIDENVYEIGDAQERAIACPTEEVDVETRCTADGGTLTVTNPNDEAVQVDVEGAGDFERRVTLAAGESRQFTDLGDGDYEVRTFSAIDENVYQIGDGQTASVACPTEEVDVETDCTDDGGALTVTNPNEEAVQVDVEGPGDFERRVTVGAGETRTFEELGDGDYAVRTFSAIDENVYEIGDAQSVTVDCEGDREAVEVETRCTEDGGVLTVENPNDRAVRVTVDGPDGRVAQVTLEDGESESFDDLADGEYTVRTETPDGAETVGDPRSVTVACPTEEVSVENRCTPDGATLTVSNPNDEAVQVDVEGAGDFERRVTVEAGESRQFTDLGDGDYTVRTFSAIDENVYEIGDERDVTVACPTEEVEVASDCDDGGALVVENPNEEAVQVDVEGPRNYERRVTVAGGDTERFTGLGNGGYQVRTFSAIDENVYQIGDQQVETVNCGGPQNPDDENEDNDDENENGDSDDENENGDSDDENENGDSDDENENGDSDDENENGDSDDENENGDSDDENENGDSDDEEAARSVQDRERARVAGPAALLV